MAVLASIDWLNGKTETRMESVCRRLCDRGAFFEINRRYEEAIAYYRKRLPWTTGCGRRARNLE